MTELDLSAEVYPCPKGSLRHRDVVKKIGGKEQFPLLVDASNGVTMYESGNIQLNLSFNISVSFYRGVFCTLLFLA
jgi:hypothetical protein